MNTSSKLLSTTFQQHVDKEKNYNQTLHPLRGPDKEILISNMNKDKGYA